MFAVDYNDWKITVDIINNGHISTICKLYIAKFCCLLVTGILVDKIGIKKFIIISLGLQVSEWCIEISEYKKNFILELSTTIFDQIWNQYIGEIAGPNYRGIFISVIVSAGLFGSIFEEFIKGGKKFIIPYESLLINLVGFLPIIESPFFSLIKNRDTEAIKTLSWLRGSNNTDDINEEFQEIKNYVNEQMKENPFSLKKCFKFSPSEYKLSAIAIFVFFLVNFIGNLAFVLYNATTKYDFMNSVTCTSISVIFSLFLIETVERKILLTIGFSITAVIHLALICMLNLKEIFQNKFMFEVLFYIYQICETAITFPVAHILKSELFPQKFKSSGNAIATFMYFLTDIPWMLSLSNYIKKSDPITVFCLINLISCIIGALFSYYVVPNTKGKSLIEIQNQEKKFDKNLIPLRNI